MKISSFATDETLETEGVWHDIGEGASVLVARAGNPNYEKRFRELTRPYRARIRNGTLPRATDDEIMQRLFAETVLLSWKGIDDEKGKPIPYSTDKAFELLRDYKDFRDLIGDLAREAEVYRKEEAEAEGNS